MDRTVNSRSRQTNLAGRPFTSQTSAGSDRTPLTTSSCLRVPAVPGDGQSEGPVRAVAGGALRAPHELLAPSATQGKSGSCAYFERIFDQTKWQEPL